MATVGIRELRDNLSEYLRRVGDGELLVITDRDRPIGELGPAVAGRASRHARELAREGVASWSGGKPKGLQEGRSRGGAWSRMR
jgi:prevent-host-death family protein